MNQMIELTGWALWGAEAEVKSEAQKGWWRVALVKGKGRK